MTHLCHAKRCEVSVPPKMLMCRSHWFMVPLTIRHRVWACFRPGQEEDKNPSQEWRQAADEAIQAVFLKEARRWLRTE